MMKDVPNCWYVHKSSLLLTLKLQSRPQHQLKLIKANKLSAAKAKWYEWKHQWVDNLLESADRGYMELQQVCHALLIYSDAYCTL